MCVLLLKESKALKLFHIDVYILHMQVNIGKDILLNKSFPEIDYS